jgi:hypothetical protein
MASIITVTVPNDPIDVLTINVPGIQGPIGLTGPTGPSDPIGIGTVATGAVGTSAIATITGTTPNKKLNLTIPVGATGAVGPLPVISTTSTTSQAIATGSKTFTTAVAMNLTVGQPVRVFNTPTPANYMTGLITAISGTSVTVNVTEIGGSGTFTAWTLVITGFQGVQGVIGNTGPANSLSIGTVTTGAVGTSASATITGTAPTQTLNLTIPTGATGATNSLVIGTVTTGAAGTSASATITGTAPNQTLNLTIPTGATGSVGNITAANITDSTTVGRALMTATDAAAGRTAIDAAVSTHTHTEITTGTDAATANTFVKRDASANATFNTVFSSGTQNIGISALTRKDYVDGQDAIFRRRVPAPFAPTAYTLALSDEGKLVYYVADNQANSITIPTNATVPFPTGAWVDILQGTAGQTTIIAASGVTLLTPGGSLLTRGTYSSARASKIATDTWVISGDLLTAADTAVTGASAFDSANTLVKRDASGGANMNYVGLTTAPLSAGAATRRDYVDNADLAFRREQSVAGTATYTFALTDEGKTVFWNTASAATFTIPNNSTVTFPIGSWIDVLNVNTGSITFALEAGVSLSTPDGSMSLRTRYSMARIWKQNTNAWFLIFGDMNNSMAQAITAATASPTASTIAKRDAAGRMQAVSPSAASDVAIKSYADALVAVDKVVPIIPAVEGVDGYVYTHSYGNPNPGVVSSNALWWQRLNNRLGIVWTNKAKSGAQMRFIMGRAIGWEAPTVPIWTPGTRGLVTIMGTINDVLAGAGTTNQAGFSNPLSSMLHYLSAASSAPASSFTFPTGTWQNGATGNTAPKFTTNAGAVASGTFTGTSVTVLLVGWASGFVTGGSAVVKVDGVTKATINTNAAQPDVDAYDYTHIPVAITGLTNASHTVTITHGGTEGQYVGFEMILIPSATPPTILLCKDPIITPNATTWPNYSSANHAIYNGLIDTAASTFATATGLTNVTVVDLNTGFVPGTMLGADGIHPNDRGMAQITNTLTTAMSSLTFRVGLNN